MSRNPPIAGQLHALGKALSLSERHLFEIAAVLTGSKKVVRVVVNDADIALAGRLLEELGLAVALPTRALAVDLETSLGDRYCRHVPLGDPAATEAALLAARSIDIAEDGRAIDENGTTAEIGALYEYPVCCITSYALLDGDFDWIEKLIEDHRQKHSLPSVLGNKLAYLFSGQSFLPDYFPCSLHCSGSNELAWRMRTAALSVGLSDLVEVTASNVSKPIVVHHGLLIQPRSGRMGHDGTVNCRGQGADVVPWRRQDTVDVGSRVGWVRPASLGIELLDREGTPIGPADPTGMIIRFQEQPDA